MGRIRNVMRGNALCIALSAMVALSSTPMAGMPVYADEIIEEIPGGGGNY